MVYIGKLYMRHPLKPVLTLIKAGAPCEWVHDSQRFLLEFFDTIHNCPSQIYHYALPFSPSTSWLHKCYTAEFSQEAKVIKGLPAGWGTSSRTVELGSIPQALACWKDTIAVGLASNDISFLDAITGSQVAVLSGHTDSVKAVTFLPDGTSLISGSNDKTLKHWDIQTGGIVKTFHGHNDWVSSTSISPDCITIASGSSDKTIRLWNIWTGECHHVIEQQERVACVNFSPTNPQHFVSVSGGVVQQWDISGHQIGPTYQGFHAAFSLDGTHVVSCGRKAAVVQNSDSGAIVAKCLPDSNSSDRSFRICCFSPDRGLVAIATDTAVYVWDITSSGPHLVGHASKATAFTFSSSSLISASLGGSVTFWQITMSTDPVIAATTSTSPPSIESVTLQAKDSIAISSDSAGVVKVWDLSTGLCKASFQTQAEAKTWRDAQMIGGKLIFVWHVKRKREIHIWDIERGEPLQTVEAHSKIRDLRISGDGSKVFCLDDKSIQAWSLWTGEAVGKVELEERANLDPLCMDDSRIWVQFLNQPTQGWDFGISEYPPAQLFNTFSERPHLHFNMDTWFHDRDVNLFDEDDGTGASLYRNVTSIEDTVTGEKVFQLFGRYGEPRVAQWDGRYLVAGYYSGDIVILDFNHLCAQ
jgi:WD40 repeat protein